MGEATRPEGEAQPRTKWEGGIIRYDRHGRRVYVIREQFDGRRYVIATDARSEEDALAEFALFKKNREKYAKQARSTAAEPIYLDDARKLAFLTWSRDFLQNDPKYVHEQKAYLGWWQERLAGVELRGDLTLAILRDALDRATCQQQRIAAIKRFLSWLRKTGKITAADDPTLFGALPVPKSRPAQHRRSKVVPPEHVDLVIEHLTAPWRDVLLLQAGTGWHTTEAIRFAEAGTIEPLPRTVAQEGVAGIVVCPKRKSGEVQRTRVSAEVLEAAKRLRKHGTFTRWEYDGALERACSAVKRPDGEIGIPVFTGAMMRHTVATLGIEGGENPISVSAHLGHKDPRTTRRFYATLASVPKTRTLR
jgi:integrase